MHSFQNKDLLNLYSFLFLRKLLNTRKRGFCRKLFISTISYENAWHEDFYAQQYGYLLHKISEVGKTFTSFNLIYYV